MKKIKLFKTQICIPKLCYLLIPLFIFLPLVAITAETQMTGTQLTQLLGEGKTLILGGSGEGYQGKLVLYPDGTGKGQAITDKGKKSYLKERGK